MSLFFYNMLAFLASENGRAVSQKEDITLYIVLGVLILVAGIVLFLSRGTSKFKEWSSLIASGMKAVVSGRPSQTDADALNEIVAVGGYAYDRTQNIYYSKLDAWQREIGYCRLYDEASVLSGMIIDCEPVYFEYGGKKWLIEFWKGQYDLMTGCEVGVYCTDRAGLNVPGIFNGVFYDCAGDNDLLDMYCALYKNNRRLFIRKDKHWWLTGFVLAEFSNPSELTMEIRITLKDKGMLDAFVKALKTTGYSASEIKVSGKSVSLMFGKARSPQPYTRTPSLEKLTQSKNKFLCDQFNEITKAVPDVAGKLKAVQEKNPDVYQKIKTIRNSERILRIFKTLKAFLN